MKKPYGAKKVGKKLLSQHQESIAESALGVTFVEFFGQ